MPCERNKCLLVNNCPNGIRSLLSNHMRSASLAGRRLLSSAHPPQVGGPSRLEALRQKLQEAPPPTELAPCSPQTGDLPGSGRLPSWLKVPIPTGREFSQLKDSLRELKLHTVHHISMCCALTGSRYVKRQSVPTLASVGVAERRVWPPRRRS